MYPKIINSYDNMKREEPRNGIRSTKRNEEQIKNCEIFINDKKIDFCYYYQFPEGGEYTIIYKFKAPIKYADFMFYKCKDLISIDLSNFNGSELTSIS